MKKCTFLLVMLGLVLMGCSEEKDVPQLVPYELSSDEKQLVHLAATPTEDLLVYKVKPGNVVVDVKVEHYQKGKLVNSFMEFSQEIGEGESFLSFGSREITLEEKPFRQWFLSVNGGHITTVKGPIADQGAYSSTSLREARELSSDQYVAVGVWIQAGEKKNLSPLVLDEKEALEKIIQDHEEVYVLLCKLKV